MSTVRRLPAGEYERLKDFADGWCPNPETSIAIVGEDNGQIVSRMVLVVIPHIEGTAILESHRGGTLLLRMMSEARKAAKELGVLKLFAFSAEDKVTEYLQRLGFDEEPLKILSEDLCQS